MAADIEQRMTLDELYSWAARFELQHEAAQQAIKDAKRAQKRVR